MNFSKRHGYEKETPLQFECMSKELKTEIHNMIRNIENEMSWQVVNGSFLLRDTYDYLWSHHFCLDSDDFKRHYAYSGTKEVKKLYDQLSWNKVFDYIEEYCELIRDISKKHYKKLCKLLNQTLEKHNSAYRILEGKIIPISNDQELDEISQASHTPHQDINSHMQKAIEIFSDRENKDYPNVVKEAITAVEAAVNTINQSPGKTLGDALKTLSDHLTIHPALIEAFSKIYGYTSDKRSGIRHAIFEGSDCIPDFADAKFMLVSCSAFINYLLLKADKSVLQIKE
ncbi:MAG TPA: hypothetical protein PKH21_05110 [Candidatus Cloacimonadota bacterium]|jgi:hypothetical protein|nr:hypothetical protein [Candidatus Cloacimonadota bacterium]HQL13153.1 hypothetical protein [Candidatus Cloacimonadota bacterium]